MQREYKKAWGWFLIFLVVSIVCAVGYFQTPIQKPAPRPNMYVLEDPNRKQPFSKPVPDFVTKDINVTDDLNVTHGMAYKWLEPLKPYPDGLKFPLVIVLHDAKGKAYAGEVLAHKQMQYAYPSFVMVPMLPYGATWYRPTSPVRKEVSGYLNDQLVTHRLMGPIIEAMIGDVIARNPIDPRRIYVVGCEMGGVGVFGLVRSRPDLMAAGFAINGGWSPEDAVNFKHVPLWITHSAQDGQYGSVYSREIARRLIELRHDIQYTEFFGGEAACENMQTYADTLWEWLFRQQRPLAARPAAARSPEKNLAPPAKNQVASPP